MKISLIVAVADNGVIGKQEAVLPWRMPADLAHFKRLTMGHPMIMGRKTYESIGRALPGRTSIVVTRDTTFTATSCIVMHSIEAALDAANAQGVREVFVIGGADVFNQVLPRADMLYLTEVHGKPEGNTYFTYDTTRWHEVDREDHPADAKNEYAYSFVTLKKAH